MRKTKHVTGMIGGTIKPSMPSTSGRAVRARRAPNNPYDNPIESDVMKALKSYLDYKFGVRGWVHVPNETIFLSWLKKWKPSIVPILLRFLTAIGLKKDFPDILIFKQTQWLEGALVKCCGMAIEVKREKGGKVRKGQREYLKYFDSIGWATAIGYGFDDTKAKIEKVYGPYCVGGG